MLLADILDKEDSDEMFRIAELKEKELQPSRQVVGKLKTDHSESRVLKSASGMVVVTDAFNTASGGPSTRFRRRFRRHGITICT